MNQKELLAVIEEARVSEATRLDLASKSLTILPAEIGNLTNLVGLDLNTPGSRTILPSATAIGEKPLNPSLPLPKASVRSRPIYR